MVFRGKSQGISIYGCPKCGLGKTDRSLVQESNYHRDQIYLEEENLFKNIFQKRVKIISSLKLTPGKALEIGCSTGLLLSLLREKGWDVQGIEISSQAAQAAGKRGIKVLTAPFEEADIKEKFDLIVVNHTLEHMADPNLVLQKIYQLLSPKGIILIGVPNFNSLSAQILGMKWPMLLPREHLWHFSQKALTTVLEKNGYQLIQVRSLSGIWDLENPFLEIWQALLGRKKRLFKEIITALADLLLSKINLGAGLIIVAEKV